MWLLAIALARANDADVLVTDFRPRDADAVPLATLVSETVASEIATIAGVHVVPLADVGLIHDTPVPMYLASCPRGEEAGCAFVVAEVAVAAYAIAGSVSSKGERVRVDASIVDVLGSEEIVHLGFDLAAGDERRFAESIAALLSGVLEGELGRSEDVRGLPSAEERARAEAERTALLQSLTADLDRELSGVLVEPRPKRRVSPLGLAEWRERSRGRTSQIVLRPFLGSVHGPIDAEYYGRYARDASGGAFVVTESYAYQATVAGTGALVGSDVAYGVLPWLEVGIEGGLASGHYRVDVGVEDADDPAVTRPEDFSSASLVLGPKALAALFPASTVRPVIGASALWWSGRPVDAHVEPPEETGTFPRPTTWTIEAIAGAEARVSRTVDFFVHVPVGVAIAGEADVRHDGSGALDDLPAPPTLDPFVVGVALGVQVRLRP
jgi:hypothetical protein